MKPCKDQPCSQCPFRRKSMPGWLGDDTPEHFVEMAHGEENLPCHKTVDYTKHDWKERQVRGPKATAHECAGAAIYRANVLKEVRDRKVCRLPPDEKTVFATPKEFIKHHRSLGLVSGEIGQPLSMGKPRR